ncbi:hypothetical protein H4219_003952 [Mycoemilia scoparia]|uniref:non-specific serine/threonine protein kinase n=1 Tax=Mycoemilia scoparia TaxID=417184 RepID=A0A9W8DRY1_9FUNG|nr:hypothetical protein H4219_003952 [Mycoemilia scoparia]
MGNSSGKLDSEEQGLHLGQFALLRCIGRGSFGKVRIVEHKSTKKQYALKYINKDECIRMRALDHILRERELLVDLENPFIVNLRYAFQDDYNMFMVLDLMTGGDLRYHLTRRRFTEPEVRLWIAELAQALYYLHQCGIVHRDVKPDNVLMDAEGHVALTDFNIATRIINNQKHYSAAGTSGYMAPELLRGQGYTYSADWWSLGILMFECLYGRRPFSQRNKAAREESRFGPLVFPQSDTWISNDGMDMIKRFLEIPVESRLGCDSKGFDGILNHRLFANIDWDKLMRREIAPVFLPNAKASNFDNTYDLEELLLEQDPLEVRPRRKHKPGHKLSPEKERIEREFLTFDYLEFERFRGYGAAAGEDKPGSSSSMAGAAIASTGPSPRPSEGPNSNFTKRKMTGGVPLHQQQQWDHKDPAAVLAEQRPNPGGGSNASSANNTNISGNASANTKGPPRALSDASPTHNQPPFNSAGNNSSSITNNQKNIAQIQNVSSSSGATIPQSSSSYITGNKAPPISLPPVPVAAYHHHHHNGFISPPQPALFLPDRPQRYNQSGGVSSGIKPIDHMAWDMVSSEQQDLAKRLSRASNRNRSPSLRGLNGSTHSDNSKEGGLLTASEKRKSLIRRQRSFGEIYLPSPIDEISPVTDGSSSAANTPSGGGGAHSQKSAVGAGASRPPQQHPFSNSHIHHGAGRGGSLTQPTTPVSGSHDFRISDNIISNIDSATLAAAAGRQETIRTAPQSAGLDYNTTSHTKQYQGYQFADDGGVNILLPQTSAAISESDQQPEGGGALNRKFRIADCENIPPQDINRSPSYLHTPAANIAKIRPASPPLSQQQQQGEARPVFIPTTTTERSSDIKSPQSAGGPASEIAPTRKGYGGDGGEAGGEGPDLMLYKSFPDLPPSQAIDPAVVATTLQPQQPL